jgi:Na+-translocating ferredoxin:NAD+ oxidoreductase RnfG subunit
MADQFQTFDKSTILSSTVTLRSWRVGVRELALAVVAIVCFMLALVLAALYGTSSQQLQEARTSAQQQRTNACKDSSCLRTTAHLTELLNTSVSPCDNFFSYACGGFRVVNPVDEYTLTETIQQQMYQQNQDRLMEILASPTKNDKLWSSERKAKDFFTSCADDFTKEQIKGQPLIAALRRLMQGWYVLEPDWSTNKAANYDFNAALKAVQVDFWVDALFAPRVLPDQTDRKTRIISVG